jgi:hypothetical protein
MSFYDALFLFVNVFVLWGETASSVYFKWLSTPRFRSAKQLVLIESSILLECILSSIITCLVFEPVGSMELVSCGMSRLSDWYPALYNPVLRHGDSMHCVNEVSYPLVTWLLVFDAFAAVLSVSVRPALHAMLHRSAIQTGKP